MKAVKNKQFVLQQKANDVWCPIGEEPLKQEALALLKYKRKVHRDFKFRVIQRVVTDTIIG